MDLDSGQTPSKTMIPYFELHNIPLGPIRLQVWGMMVALGIVFGLWLGRRRAVRQGLDGEVFVDIVSWALLAGMVGSRVLYVLAYEPQMIVSSPLSVIRVWDGGLSAIGGFIGAGLVFMLMCQHRKVSFLNYANAAAFALPWSYAIGRIGCFLIHDHVGIASSSFIAVNFPGGSRLDLGLIHILLGIAIGCTFLIMDRISNNGKVQFFLWFVLLYGLARVGLDFLRFWGTSLGESRYLFLTPAQLIALPAIATSFWLIFFRKK